MAHMKGLLDDQPTPCFADGKIVAQKGQIAWSYLFVKSTPGSSQVSTSDY